MSRGPAGVSIQALRAGLAKLRQLFKRGKPGSKLEPRCYLWARRDLLALYYFIHKADCQSRPSLPEGEWERVDSLSEQIPPDVVILLTEGSAEREGKFTFIFFEPLVDVVIALSHTERRASIHANGPWGSRGAGFTELTNQAERLLQQGRVSEALILSIRRLCEIFNGSR